MEIYKLRNSVEVYKDKENIHILTLEKHLTFILDEGLIYLLRILEHGSEIENIYNSLKNNGIVIEKEELIKIIQTLKSHNIISVIKKESAMLSKEKNTYSRQIEFFENFDGNPGMDTQNKLFKSTVAVIGIGGIGSWTAYSLAMSGIGNILLIDPDRIQCSNLTRQIGYDIHTIGNYKVDVLANKIKQLNPLINVNKYKNKILTYNKEIEEIFSNVDFVISCIDEPNITTAGKIISDICWKHKIPHIISGGYNGHQGMIGPTIIPGKTLCWECIVDYIEKEYEGWKQIIKGKATGSLGCLSAVVSNIQVWECIRILISNVETPMQNSKGEFNFNNLELEIKKFYKTQKCDKCN
ncbi:TPA: ThiF family adenylyltransferase [Staphylococcus aureus]|uniref:HesA/MoeB/ThiF family protein n=1 Tax=Staphylococcus aureus TaxID=1280 RepID=UPI00208F926C|nr:ThiF family adenylyltransferase [Staphylococcus aureus]MCO4428818.1 molybdopterin biosynthesis protein MoeB [Staphylococcus aureus]UXU24864.1 ThiF family adenylyltransferase [Staphylococcus aureus]HCD1989651.1 ThiF family adenylyltransferase [Staphylococcus aureus]HCX9225399.1 ThiF family adenylyltransferase [Staphylococcus aureus]HDA7828751.1 ThiF family adenylyltransferase [Staphylococcus aureus]